MKNILTPLKALVFSSLMLSSAWGFGQCKTFVKQVDFSPLNAFEYCGDVKVAQMYSNSQAEVQQKVESNKRYRILADAQDYLGEIQLSVINQKGDTISIEVNANEQRYWEIINNNKGKVDIQLTFKNDNIDNGINASGCVVLAIGKMENNNLVQVIK